MGRESTWPINFSRDAREMLNDSCEIKCWNSVLLLPSSRWLAKAKARGHVSLSLEYLPSFWQALALGLPEAEVVSGSMCSKATDGLIICQLLQIFFKISYREYFVSLFCLWFCRNNGPGLERCWSPELGDDLMWLFPPVQHLILILCYACPSVKLERLIIVFILVKAGIGERTSAHAVLSELTVLEEINATLPWPAFLGCDGFPVTIWSNGLLILGHGLCEWPVPAALVGNGRDPMGGTGWINGLRESSPLLSGSWRLSQHWDERVCTFYI